jgi:hypothetical protein
MMEEQINRIERTLMLRYWLFGIIILVLVVQCWLIFLNATAIRAVEKRQAEQDSAANLNRAMVEGSIRSQTIFQNTVAAVMDKLSKENSDPAKIKRRGIMVPRVPIKPPDPGALPPSPLPSVVPAPLTDAELTRSPGMSPKPKPAATRKKKAKPSPTPGFFKRLFNPRSTR